MAQEYDGRRPASLDFFLDFLQITEAEFLELAMKHQVSPHEHKIEFDRGDFLIRTVLGGDRDVVHRLGFKCATTLEDAFEIAEQTVGRYPTVTHLRMPPIMLAEVEA